MNRKCFALMPFTQCFDGIWEIVIRPTVEGQGDECTRADDFFAPGPIMNAIVHAIESADYLIADLTGRNPNVFYELGLAHSMGKPVILLTQNVGDVPFDLKHQRLIEYADTAAGASALRTAIDKCLTSIP